MCTGRHQKHHTPDRWTCLCQEQCVALNHRKCGQRKGECLLLSHSSQPMLGSASATGFFRTLGFLLLAPFLCALGFHLFLHRRQSALAPISHALLSVSHIPERCFLRHRAGVGVHSDALRASAAQAPAPGEGSLHSLGVFGQLQRTGLHCSFVLMEEIMGQ